MSCTGTLNHYIESIVSYLASAINNEGIKSIMMN